MKQTFKQFLDKTGYYDGKPAPLGFPEATVLRIPLNYIEIVSDFTNY